MLVTQWQRWFIVTDLLWFSDSGRLIVNQWLWVNNNDDLLWLTYCDSLPVTAWLWLNVCQSLTVMIYCDWLIVIHCMWLPDCLFIYLIEIGSRAIFARPLCAAARYHKINTTNKKTVICPAQHSNAAIKVNAGWKIKAFSLVNCWN